MNVERGAMYFEILYTIPGRHRIHPEKPVASERLFADVVGVRQCRYSPRIRTLLCEYDPERVGEDALTQYNEDLYAYWLAAGFPADADEAMLKNVITLFCEENLAEMGEEEPAA